MDDQYNIEQLFDEAVALPAGRRDAFLEEKCGSNKALLAELRQLLAGHDSAGGFDDLLADFAPIVGGLRDLNPDEGKHLGPYQIQSEIGRGGMAEVYKAKRIEGDLDQVVAIKIMHAGLGKTSLSDRFRSERKTLAKLNHPHIARFISAGQTDDNLLYLVLEYIEGENLLDWCISQSQSLKGKIKLAIQIAQAVDYAHQNLIVHRDLKPGNILVTKEGNIKLLDFGIAKLLKADPQTDLQLTQTGQQFFTPQYAAPEQIKNETITTATDIFSLGIILYRLLTGEFPWKVSAEDIHEYKLAICETPAILPSMRSKEDSTLAALKGDLDAIILKALSKKPEDRYSSAGGFAADLENYLAGRPVTAQQQTFVYRSRKMIQRFPLRSAGVLVLMLSLVFGSIFTLNEAQKAKAAQRVAQNQTDQSMAVAAFLSDLFITIDPERTIGKDLTVADLLNEAGRRVALNGDLDPETKLMLEGIIRQAKLQGISEIVPNAD